MHKSCSCALFVIFKAPGKPKSVFSFQEHYSFGIDLILHKTLNQLSGLREPVEIMIHSTVTGALFRGTWRCYDIAVDCHEWPVSAPEAYSVLARPVILHNLCLTASLGGPLTAPGLWWLKGTLLCKLILCAAL